MKNFFGSPISDLNAEQIDLLLDVIVEKLYEENTAEYNLPHAPVCEVFTPNEVKESLLKKINVEKKESPNTTITDIQDSVLDELNQDAMHLGHFRTRH